MRHSSRFHQGVWRNRHKGSVADRPERNIRQDNAALRVPADVELEKMPSF